MLMTAKPDSVNRKKSFLRLPINIDVTRLLADFDSIPHHAWSSSHWDIHGSTDMLLLRGGSDGTPDDFTTSEVVDHAILTDLPYIRWIVGDDGPLGGTTYAFLFRMKPMGVSRLHIDSDDAWEDPYRVHIAITTNDDAFLLAEGRGKHLGVGEVWTFDNQQRHGAVNGDGVRTHLIVDVPPNVVIEALLDDAEFDPGSEEPRHWERAGLPDAVPSQPYFIVEPLNVEEKKTLELPITSFASRIVELTRVARFARTGLKVGDVICSVNGVSESALARTPADYVQIVHRPGDVVELVVLRDGRSLNRRLRLFRPDMFETVMKLQRRLVGIASP
jgi:hypothetical protein